MLIAVKNLYFTFFFRAFTKVCTCSCWAHTKCKCNAGFSGFSSCGSLLQHRQFVFDDL